jgi:hypothetical protein
MFNIIHDLISRKYERLEIKRSKLENKLYNINKNMVKFKYDYIRNVVRKNKYFSLTKNNVELYYYVINKIDEYNNIRVIEVGVNYIHETTITVNIDFDKLTIRDEQTFHNQLLYALYQMHLRNRLLKKENKKLFDQLKNNSGNNGENDECDEIFQELD